MCSLASWAVKEGRKKKKKKKETTKHSTGRKLKTKGNGEREKKKSHIAFLPLVVVPPNGLRNSLLN